MPASNYPNTRSRSLPALFSAVTEEDIQAQLLKEYAQERVTESSSLSDHPNSDDLHSPSISASSSSNASSSDISNDPASIPTTPLSSIRVLDIERELSLTCVQADDLHRVMRSAMLKAGLLGNMNFKTNNEAVLAPTLATMRAELRFLNARIGKNRGKGKMKEGEGKLSEDRLEKLLCARARILNDNEKHNRYMLRTGKVARRRDGSVNVREITAEQVDDGPEAPVSVSTALEQLYLDAQVPASAEHVDKNAPSSLPRPSTPSYPSAFIIRVLNSPSGAAILPLQLTMPNHASLSFDLFIQHVSEQVGFNVRGRLSAVMPKSNTVKVRREEIWWAVLQAWENMCRRTGEFVVE
jgi:hypothetical protein